MNTFRAMCAELLQPLAEYDSANPYHEHRDLITRARAKLAELEPDDLDNNRSTDIRTGAAFERKRICAVIDHTADHLHEIKEIGDVDPALYTFGRIVLRLLSRTVKNLPDFEISFDESDPTP
jgi:hypothetical protein